LKKLNVLKGDITYKELRCLLKDMLGKPDFADIIKNGVSLKWYYFMIVRNTTEYFREKIKENIIKEIPKIMLDCFDIKVKLLPSLNDDYDGGVLYRNRPRRGGNSLRILIKRKILNE
jgi:hypothetical protein